MIHEYELTKEARIPSYKAHDVAPFIKDIEDAVKGLCISYYNAMNADYGDEPLTDKDEYFSFSLTTPSDEYLQFQFSTGDEGGPAAIHVIYVLEEDEQYDYKTHHMNDRRGEVPFLGWQVSWQIRCILWDFDTMIDHIYNDTTTVGVKEPFTFNSKSAMPQGNEDDMVYDGHPATSPWVADRPEVREHLCKEGEVPQEAMRNYYENNPHPIEDPTPGQSK